MNYNEEISDIQDDLLENMPDSYSKIKGCWLWEMMKAFALKIYELLALLTDTASKLDIEKLQGDELDAYVKQWTDIERKTAQRASGYIDVTGQGIIYSGTLVAAGSVQYEVVSDVTINGTASVPVVAVEAGEKGNAEAGTVTTMITSNANVQSITNLKPIEGGTDEETDESLRDRYYIRLSMPATSGNRAHYVLWARECPGVGEAKALRDTTIRNRVNVFICSDDGNVADSVTVKKVQDYIDPNVNGDGSGIAPIGAICKVYSAVMQYIDLQGTVELDNTLSADDTLNNIKTAINKYLAQINFKKTELSYARLLNVVLGCDGVSDVTDFKINDDYANVVCGETYIFVLRNFELGVE